MKSNKKPDNSIRIIMAVNGKKTEISNLDMRKFELINYYAKQSGKGAENQIEQFKTLISESFNEAVNKQYKKYVPAAVRTMYEELLANSSIFGATESTAAQVSDLDKTSPDETFRSSENPAEPPV